MKKIAILSFAIVLAVGCKSNKDTLQVDNDDSRTEKRRERGGPPSVDEVFKMDTNLDGLLSKSEVKGRLLEQFSTIDTNNDGFISRTEFENAPRPKRGQRGQRRN